MFIWTARFSKKKAVLSVIAMGFVMAALILLVGRTTEPAPDTLPQLTNHFQRISYLQTLGWEVESEPVETLQFLMPSPLEEPYLTYNTLQVQQGFDLSSCCGKQVSRFTYTITNYPDRPTGVQANLYICEDLPVAGDIFCPGAEGFQSALIPEKASQQ